MEKRVWCILRPNFINRKMKNLGIMGAGFFISEFEFITAHHILNPSCFCPNKTYNNEEIFLINAENKVITLNLNSNINYFPNKDLTKVRFDEGRFDFFEIDISPLTKGDSVINLGFPTEKVNEIIKFKENNLSLKKIFCESGRILHFIPDFASRSNDVNIDKKPVIINDYTSSLGFSGGPLLKDGKVVGMMSMLVPFGYGDFSGKSVAIFSSNFN